MTCRACGHSDEKDVTRPFLERPDSFQYIGWVKGIDRNLIPKSGAYSLGSITKLTELFACPKCGTVRIKLAGEQP